MSKQAFKTVDVLKLQVEDAWPGLPNLVPNPRGEFGAWGWRQKVAFNFAAVAGPAFRIQRSGVGTFSVGTDLIPVRGSDLGGLGVNRYVRGRITRIGGTSGIGFQAKIDTYGKGGLTDLLATGTLTASKTTNGDVDIPAFLIGNLVKYVVITVVINSTTTGHFVDFSNVCLVNGTSGEVAVTPTVEPTWVDILSPATSMSIVRDELNLGILSAVVRDSSLDPSQAAIIRKGKKVKATALASGTGLWETLFAGTLLNADVTYDLQHPNPAKRARIALQAVDPASILAATPSPDGVATIADLPQVLDGARVPWNVNGSTSPIFATTVVAKSDNASVIEQISLTRDTVLGYAWVSRKGILNAWDAASITGTVVSTLDETDYTDLQLGFNTDDLINDVTVIVRALDAATGETKETRFGPYTDGVSAREWGKYHADFTVQGTGWTNTTAETYANLILAANRTPRVRVNSIAVPVMEAAHIATDRGLLDLYDKVTVSNTAKAVTQSLRITRIVHTIEPEKWTMRLGFSEVGSVAQPQIPTSTPKVGPAALPSVPLTTTPSTTNGSYLFRDGRAVHVVVNATTTAALGGGAALGNIPAGHRSTATLYFAGVDSASGNLTPMYIDSSGNVGRVFGTPSGAGTLASHTYISPT